MSASSSLPNPTGQTNIFTLAADGSSARLRALLRADPALARAQDATGYSLAHALASYGHVALLRALARDFALPAALRDEDGETALFVAESVAAAQCLVDELGVDWRARNLAGLTAEESIRAEGDFVAVADFLAAVRRRAADDADGGDGGGGTGGGEGGGGGDVVDGEDASASAGAAGAGAEHPPPLPPGVRMEIGAVADEQLAELQPDPDFRRRIEELAARQDFQGEEGQAELRRIVQDALRGVGSDDRDVRQRTA